MTDLARLRLLLLGFVVALALPAGVLVNHAYDQLQWQAFFAARQQAQGLSEQVDQSMAQLASRMVRQPMDLANEQRAQSGWDGQIPPAFRFLPSLPAGEGFSQGLLGLFEVDQAGRLWSSRATSPVRYAPASSAAGPGEPNDEPNRQADSQLIRRVLLNNELITPVAGRATLAAPVPTISADYNGASLQSTELAGVDSTAFRPEAGAKPKSAPVQTESRFDRLADDELQQSLVRRRANYGQVADLKLDQSLEKQAASRLKKARPEAPLMEAELSEPSSAMVDEAIEPRAEPMAELGSAEDFDAITTFRGGTEAFQFSLLDSGHFVLFRNLWGPQGRVVQGALFDSEMLLAELRRQIRSASVQGVQVLLAYGGTVLDVVGATSTPRDYSLASQADGQLLYRSRLSPPISSIELVYYAEQLPLGAGLQLLGWLSLTLLLVLLGGALALYRLGLGQLQLARQQRDFVSAVSHELKTPLTSIRMYGEMLVQGLATKERQPQYFRYIFDESERLSRLIDNVLQLARFDRGEMAFKTGAITIGELLDLVQSRIASQVAAADFQLQIDPSDLAQAVINVDVDAMLQVFINLTDNALKFSRGAQLKRIEIDARRKAGKVLLSVRDYGPGISQDQIGKIFRLFYRSESELTRDTTGTGIGLSLVQQIVSAMGGTVDVIQSNPGARFEVALPLANSAADSAVSPR